MSRKTLFPEIATTVKALSQAEKDEIAARLIDIWLDPPEVTSHWEKGNKVVKEGTPGAEEKKTSTAHHAKSWRIRRAINDSSLSKDRRDELGLIKHTLYKVDDELLAEADSVDAQIERSMNSGAAPENKAELDAGIAATWIPVDTYTQKFMDAKVGKIGSTFAEFKQKYGKATPMEI